MNMDKKEEKKEERPLDTTTNEQARERGVEIVGHQLWRTVVKAWDKKAGWMKSTKALEIPGLGVLVQVTTKEGSSLAEATCFVIGATLQDMGDGTYSITRP
jgi:hypothetical protein